MPLPLCALAHAVLSSTLPAQILPILSDTAQSLPNSLGHGYLSFLWSPLALWLYFCFCTTVICMEIFSLFQAAGESVSQVLSFSLFNLC